MVANSCVPDVTVWRVELDGREARARDVFADLSDQERQRASRFRRRLDGKRWAVARAALRNALAYHLRCAPDAVVFDAAPGGKPVLADPAPDLHFNLAHAGGLALVAVSTRAPVGVDLEEVREFRGITTLVDRCFAADERSAWYHLPPAERTRAFFLAWTRKESVIKATGAGLTVPLEAVQVSLDASAEPEIRNYPGHPEAREGWSLRHLDPRDSYLGAVTLLAPTLAGCRLVDLAAIEGMSTDRSGRGPSST